MRNIRLVMARWIASAGAHASDLSRGDDGDAIVELAMLVGIFGVPLLLGTVDLATVAYSSIEISSAAQAAATYGMTSATMAADNTDMTLAARAEAPDFGTSLSVTPTTFYSCSAAIGGTQYTTQSAANSACSGSGNHALEFLQVTVSAPVTPSIHFPGVPRTFTLNSSCVIEVEE